MSISVNQLTKKFGSQIAVNNISFQIEKGIVGFLGPNGAGKSTTMKMVTGFLPSDSGEVLINGMQMHVYNNELKGKIGYLPESNPLYPDMYVQEYLQFVARVHQLKNITKHTEEVIQTVGLHPEVNKKIGSLSKGYRQRVGLAAALVHHPDVLILDEPTSGLDPNQIVEIRSVIKSLAETKTILFSSHIMQEVEWMCNKVIIINKGTIVANGDLDTLRKKVASSEFILVEFSEMVAYTKLRELPHIIEATAVKEGVMWRIETKHATEMRKVLLQFSIEKQLNLLSLQSEEQNLESVFQSLTL